MKKSKKKNKENRKLESLDLAGAESRVDRKRTNSSNCIEHGSLIE